MDDEFLRIYDRRHVLVVLSKQSNHLVSGPVANAVKKASLFRHSALPHLLLAVEEVAIVRGAVVSDRCVGSWTAFHHNAQLFLLREDDQEYLRGLCYEVS